MMQDLTDEQLAGDGYRIIDITRLPLIKPAHGVNFFPADMVRGLVFFDDMKINQRYFNVAIKPDVTMEEFLPHIHMCLRTDQKIMKEKS